MNRRDFIQKGCTACLSVTVMAGLLSSCGATHYIAGKLGKDGLMVPLDDFKTGKGPDAAFRSFIIIRNEALQYPICVYRFSQTDYSALWMRCSHQGAELQVSGDAMHCPAHGSEFNSKGQVTSGPAAQSLRSFPVTVSDTELFIDLRKA